MIVDTLFDERAYLTNEMLIVMEKAEPLAFKNIVALVNSHSNGDHYNGNNCVNTEEIISSEASLEEMHHESPEMMAGLLLQAPNMGKLGNILLSVLVISILQALPGSYLIQHLTKKLLKR